MAFLNTIILSLGQMLLEWAFKKFKKEASAKAAQIKKEKEQGITNAENTIKYEQAVDRAEKVKASLDILNRTQS